MLPPRGSRIDFKVKRSSSGLSAATAPVLNSLLTSADCANCPFAKDKKPNKPVLGEGPPDARGILIGEGPGYEEAEQGRPFVGATGRQLDLELANASLQRGRFFLVNATCCLPPAGRTEKQMWKAVKCCRPVLLAQLSKYHPLTPMFAMGKWAYSALMGEEVTVMHARGFVQAKFKIPRK